MSITAKPSKLQAWLMAARPRTLPAAVAPVLVGCGLAIADGVFRPLPALGAFLGSLLIQISVNFANDYFDFMSGVDTPERLGPPRAAASGLLSPAELRLGIGVALALSVLDGLAMLFVGGWPVAAIVAFSVLCALIYSGGPFPLASNALGDLFAFLFFGPVAVWGTYWVQALTWDWRVLAASVPIGALIAAILVVNNLRDIETDRKANKRTLAVLIGVKATRTEYDLLLAAAYLMLPVLHLAGDLPPTIYLPLLSIPLAVPLIRSIHTQSGPPLNKTLAGTARLTLVFAVLFTAGLALPLP